MPIFYKYLEKFERYEKRIDYTALFFGVCSVLLIIFPKDGNLPCTWLTLIFTFISGIFGAIYVLSFICLWFFRRDIFDRYLVKSNYLLKVLCVVTLIPVTATMLWTAYEYASQVKEHGLSCLKCVPRIDENKIVKLDEKGDNEEEGAGLFWAIYYHFIDPGNQHMAVGKDMRFWLAIISVAGVFLMNGVLVSSVVGWIDRRKELWRKGGIKYKRRHLGNRRHYVIIGASDGIYGIIRTIFSLNCEDKEEGARGYPYLIIQTSSDVENFRNRLFSELDEEQQRKVIILYGNRTSEGDLDALLLENAKEVYILGENVNDDDTESYHDTMNMLCVKNISKKIANVPRFYHDEEKKIDERLVCRVMFEYQATFNVLQTTDINDKKINFCPFNYYEMWAQKVLVRQELKKKDENGKWVPLENFEKIDKRNENEYLPIEGYDGIKKDDSDFVHFVVVGMSRMGIAMAIEVAHLAHYPNFETKGKRTRITFIDPSMEQEMNFFKGRFKEMFSVARQRYVDEMTDDIYDNTSRFPWKCPLTDKGSASEYTADSLGGEFLDIEWEFIGGSLENPCVQKYLVSAAENRDAKLTIAVCMPNNSQAVAAAAYIDDKVYTSDSLLQVLVYQRLNNELVCQINGNKRYCKRMKAFGMANEFYEYSLTEIAGYIGKKIGKEYAVCRDSQVSNMIARMKKIDSDTSVILELCPSYGKLTTGQRQHVKDEWKKWIEENGIPENDWRKKKIRKHIEIDQYLGISRRESMDNPEAAKVWSNNYNQNTMWTKFRSVTTNNGEPFNPLSEGSEFDRNMLEELAKVEHNRWCVERLLMRFRPLTPGEQKKASRPKLLSSDVDKEIFKAHFAHLDICSNEVLEKIDFNVSASDYELTRIIPGTYREYIREKEKKNDA